MNSNFRRFKISSLISMARITEDMEQRERYISLAEEELENMSSATCFVCKDSVESFISLKTRFDSKKRISRADIYKLYLCFCKKNNFKPISKNILYRILRDNGAMEFKSNGERFFGVEILED